MVELLIHSLTAYALTFVITSSSLFEPLRSWVVTRTPKLAIRGNKHLVNCRMCTGFWMSLLVCVFTSDIELLLPVYGLSYFLATQER